MAEISFYPAIRSIEVPDGTTILQAARLAGVLIESPCNGAGTCGKCTVMLKGATLRQVADGESVLSCQTDIMGDVSVEVPCQDHHMSLQIHSAGKARNVACVPHIRKLFSQSGQITNIYAGDNLIDIEPGDTTDLNFGVVVDIGTTTLAASLNDMSSGAEIAVVTALNPQSHHAQDVLSRIKFASENHGLHEMRRLLLEKIDLLIAELASVADIDTGSVYEVVFSGNTCMLHLALGLSPASLGKYPYKTLTSGNLYENAAVHNLNMARNGRIYVPPLISSYIGADIAAGILAAGLCDQDGITMLVDIGTNGEIAMCIDGALYATSAAAGPAFEGMNLSCGMRATRGAVETFAFDEDNGIKVETVGGTEAAGICGSGVLDVVGELLAHGVINRNGRFNDPCSGGIHPMLQERLFLQEGQAAFMLVGEVFLTQQDVRQVQLAKGALRAAIELLLLETGKRAAAVDRIFIAGSFGYHLREKNLLETGLLPAEFAGRIEFVGNTSLSGGRVLLLNRYCRSRISDLAKDIRVIEPARYKDFDRLFVSCLGF